MSTKYCYNCEKELPDDCEYCPTCGQRAFELPSEYDNGPIVAGTTKGETITHNKEKDEDNNELDTIEVGIVIFMAVTVIASIALLIPLLWTIPMSVRTYRRMKSKKKIKTSMKVCSFFFNGIVVGILLFMRKDESLPL